MIYLLIMRKKKSKSVLFFCSVSLSSLLTFMLFHCQALSSSADVRVQKEEDWSRSALSQTEQTCRIFDLLAVFCLL